MMATHLRLRMFRFLIVLLLLVPTIKPLQAQIDVLPMCERVKQCALNSFDENQMPEQMREIIAQQIDQKCASGFSNKQQEIQQAGLIPSANECLDSMLDLSCAQLLSFNESQSTQACRAFRDSADKAGIDLEN